MTGFIAGALLGMVAGFCLGLGYDSLMRKRKRKINIAKTPAVAPAPRISIDDLLSQGDSDASEPVDSNAELRQNLRLKFMYDEEKVERAIAFERERKPDASMKDWMQAAVQRWERDNR